ncbi:GspH/FimT family pseudopilin [Oceanobacter sp. 5_MG-2023]|uniref:GspH/FimT family pseudopilin n=1 Tax=Oceanobacter sp. 5_MG-2023 TaxID=3062645 RepID=UPI0026E1FCBD|nr:GspH/FimT family pseudopilin [Oceanobacter sp. 5_MG-2023]
MIQARRVAVSARGPVAGLTLIELMITIAVFAILAAVGTPSMTRYLNNQTADRIARQLHTDIQYARSHAANYKLTVNVQPKSGSWSNGWEVREATSNTILRQASLDSSDGTITASSMGSGLLSFNGAGRATAVGALTIKITGCSGNRVYRIEILAIGQIIRSESAC